MRISYDLAFAICKAEFFLKMFSLVSGMAFAYALHADIMEPNG